MNTSVPDPTTPDLRPYGLDAGKFVVPNDFDDPLAEEILKEFEGVTPSALDDIGRS
jgi:hypothetical protein